jgi:hypothetical protein
MDRALCWMICLVAIGCSQGADKPQETASMSRFESGQIWRYKTRPGEERSRLKVVKVESHEKLGTIVHIQINDVAIKSSSAPEGMSKVISHLPYSEKSLSDSVTTLEKENVSSDGWEEGYDEWKSAFDDGKAGIWTVSVSEAISFLEQALNQH